MKEEINLTKTNAKKLAGAAIIVMTAIIFSRITGFLRENLITNLIAYSPLYGLKYSDAYNAAFTISNAMYNMLIGGAISAALVPVFSGYIEKDEEKKGWKAISVFTNVIFLTMVLVCILAVIFAPQVVTLITPGYSGAKFELIVKFTRILFPSVGFMMLTGIVNGVLNSYQRFTIAAYGAVIYNVLSILSIVFLYTISIEAVCYGVLASSFIYFAIQLLFTLRHMKFYKPSFDLRDTGFIHLYKLAIPSIIASSIIQVNVIIITRFMSTFDEGSLTAYRNADTIWQTPLGIFAQSIGIALLPTLSAKLASGDYKEFNSLYKKGMRSILIVIIPSAIAFMTISKDIMKVLFKNRQSSDINLINTSASILMFFAIALVAQSICNMTNRAFYADNNTKTPMLIGGSTILFNLILCYFLRQTPLGVSGIALSYAIVSTINAVLLIFILNKRMKGIGFGEIKHFVIKLLPASIVMAGVLLILARLSPIPHVEATFSGKIIQISYLGLETIVGSFVYFALAIVFKVEEASSFVNSMFAKFKLKIRV